MNPDASADPSAPQFSDGPEVYRPWLNLLARLQLDSLFLGKFDASDIVQQTLLEAHRCRAQFRGNTPQQYRAWLRGILQNVVRHEVRRYRGVEARRIDREAIQRSADQSTQRLEAWLQADGPSPSGLAIESEQACQLAAALASLPADYQEVIVLRNLEGLSHEQVAERMGRSLGAVRMLWLRALAALRGAMPTDSR